MNTVALYLFSFFVYAFIGWAGEGLYVRVTEGRWVNRSFVNAPFFLLYGVGAIGPAVIFSPSSSLWCVAITGLVYAAIVEYSGSVIMEKVGLTYWDYSKKWGNLHGRICVESMAMFVVGISLAVTCIQPLLTAFFVSHVSSFFVAAIFMLTGYVGIDLMVRIVRQRQYYRRVGHVVNYAYDRKSSR